MYVSFVEWQKKLKLCIIPGYNTVITWTVWTIQRKSQTFTFFILIYPNISKKSADLYFKTFLLLETFDNKFHEHQLFSKNFAWVTTFDKW